VAWEKPAYFDDRPTLDQLGELRLMFDDSISERFAAAWTEVLASGPSAMRLHEIQRLDYQSFKEQLCGADAGFLRNLVQSINQGDLYVFLNAYDPQVLKGLRQSAYEYARATPPSDLKMVDGCPNTHSLRDWHSEDKGGYSSTSHLFHFFRWNNDPLGVFGLFDELYQIMKLVSGLPTDSFRENIPSDGTIDRIEVAHYPQGVGGIGFHTDPIGNIRFMCTVTLTELGTDYRLGGFAVVDQQDHVRQVEPLAPLGSIVGFLPSICHGVEVIDPDQDADWDGNTGRWFVGLSCVDSEVVPNRAFTRPVMGLPTLREQVTRYHPKSSEG
jgi:hypothetical protein